MEFRMSQNKFENSENLDDVIVIAITGSISSGKSEVCKIIEKNNFKVVNTDDLAKVVISRSTIVKEQILKEFGKHSFKDGKFNSEYISSQVFGNEENNVNNLIKLNAIIHPPVIEKMIEEIEYLSNHGHKLIFVESALIFEAGLEDGFDYIIMVDSNEEIRRERFVKRTQLSREQFDYRNQSQINPQFKRENSDFVIENNLDFENLEKSTIKLLEIIKFLPKNEF